MKLLNFFCISVLTCLVLCSCNKPFPVQENILADGTLLKDNSGSCMPVNINGIYKVNAALNATHYMDVSVNVSSAGDYRIVTQAVNGIYFGDSARFTTTGTQVVRLKGYGTPVAAGTFAFTVHFGNISSCAVPVTVSPAGGPAAVFTLTGAPGACTAPLIQGTYTAGTTLNNSHKLVVGVNVTTPGDYTLSTAIVNGIGFSAAGNFAVTGVQTVTLSGTGTPLTAGTNMMLVTGSATGCNFPLEVYALSIPDPAKFILIATREAGAGSQNTTSLTCYNFDRSIKWRRNNLGNTSYRRNGNPGNAFYANGIVYFSQDSMFQVGANYYTINNFFAIDINTGNDIWTKRSQTDHIQYPIVNNGIIYCNFQQSGVSNIAAFNAANGALLWTTPVAEPFGADSFIIDGNMLYFFSVKNPSEIYLNALDLTTRTIKWKIPMGANFFRVLTPMILEGQILYLEDAAGKMIALDKTTGSTVWATATGGYSRSFHIANNLLYLIDANNKFNALNLATGALVLSWSTSMNTSVLAMPYPHDHNMYFTGIDTAGNNFITSYSAVNGGVNWRRNTPTFVEEPLVTGNTMYTLENNIPTGVSRIVMYDSNTGIYQDAISITPWEFGNIRIVTQSGKFIYPYSY